MVMHMRQPQSQLIPPSASPAVSTVPSLRLRLSPTVVQMNLSNLAFETVFAHLSPPWPGEWTSGPGESSCRALSWVL